MVGVSLKLPGVCPGVAPRLERLTIPTPQEYIAVFLRTGAQAKISRDKGHQQSLDSTHRARPRSGLSNIHPNILPLLGVPTLGQAVRAKRASVTARTCLGQQFEEQQGKPHLAPVQQYTGPSMACQYASSYVTPYVRTCRPQCQLPNRDHHTIQ